SVLAGLLKAPSRYSPIRDKAAAIRRGDQVIKNMVTQGFISSSYAALVKRQSLALVPQKGSQFRYFVDWVVDRTSGFIGRPDSDLIVRTTLDPQLQSIAGRAVRKNLDRTVLTRGGTQAALVTLDKGGAIRALVGGVNYKTSQFNRVTQALRQPGSAFKVFVYLAALEEGFEPEDVLQDGPIKIDGWEPRNYDGKFRGDVTLIDAVSGSLNSVAVKLSETIGREKVIAMAQRLGITTPLKSHPSLALGVNEVTLLELTSAYAVLANQGLNAWPYGITEIRDTQGSILYRRVGSVGRLLETQVVDRMVTMLRKTVQSGTGRAAQISRRAAGKTGTSQDFRDAWFLGFADGLTTGVWVGNDKGRPMKRLTGGSIPAKIWRDLMKEGASR
ncbi:MAG: penicillin-binding transpeptidase domain-containing protein, partial [Rhodospirillaceae bacterium]